MPSKMVNKSAKSSSKKVNKNAKSSRKKWTIMVFMEGDNNLADEMIGALQQAQEADLDENFTLVVLFDTGGPRLKTITRVGRRKAPVLSSSVTSRPKRLELKDAPDFKRVFRPPKPLQAGQVARPVSPGYRPGQDGTVKAERVRDILQAFIRDTVRNHQAEHYMLILSGHGSGAVGDFLGSNRRSSNLSIQDIGRVLDGVTLDLREGPFALKGDDYKGIDILGFDSCLMSMTEVAYEVSHSAAGSHVGYLVGAEGFEPDNGWPYARILDCLNRLADSSKLDPKNVATQIVQVYTEDYLDYTDADISTDLAALDLERIDGLKTALNSLAMALQQGIDDDRVRDAIVLAHWEAQGYKFEQYADVWDFCNCLSNRSKDIDARIAEQCEAVKDYIAGNSKIPPFVLRSCYTGAAFQHSHGVSVFFPWARMTDAAGTSDLDHYATLKFATETKWNEFLESYVDKTQRKVRNGDEEVDPNDKRFKDRFEDSRLNRRQGVFTGKPGKFDPELDTLFDPELDTLFDPELDTLSSGKTKTTTMKNAPVRWLPCKS